jgi:hypothetical protein
VNTTIVDLPFIDVRGRRQTVYATMRDSGVWELRGIVGGRSFTKECGSWQAVERTVSWLRRRSHEPVPGGLSLFGTIAASVALMLLFSGAAVAQPHAESPAVRAFAAATRDYAQLHRRVESTLPRLEVTSNPETIYQAVKLMSAAMRAARPNARAGEFFTEPLAVELRARIAEALAVNGFTPDDVRANAAAERMVIDLATPALPVNGTFPWPHASSMFPCVLAALPALPPELQYRLVGDTLVLIDLHADLIVDVLPYAIADTER